MNRRLEILNLAEIQIDRENYQRSLGKSYKRIAANFDELLFHTPVVSRRADGTLWVVDGQHRIYAEKERLSETVECLVYTGLTIDEEKRMFSQQNLNKRSITPYEAYQAGKDLTGTQHNLLKQAFEAAGVIPSTDKKEGAPRCIGDYLDILRVYGLPHTVRLLKVMKRSQNKAKGDFYISMYTLAISKALRNGTDNQVLAAINEYPLQTWHTLCYTDPAAKERNLVLKEITLRR